VQAGFGDRQVGNQENGQVRDVIGLGQRAAGRFAAQILAFRFGGGGQDVRCQGHAGRNAVDPYAGGSEFLGQCPAPRHQSAYSGDVGGIAGGGTLDHRADDVDDGSRTAFQHGRENRLGAQDRRFKRTLELRLKVLPGNGVRGFRRKVDAGVVDQGVERAEFRGQLLHHLLNGTGIGEFGVCRRRASARHINFRRQFDSARGIVAVVDAHGGALPGHGAR